MFYGSIILTGLEAFNGVTRCYSSHTSLCNSLATVMLSIETLLIGGAAVVSDG